MDLVALLPRLELTVGQMARVTDLSIRQISYWTEKGLLKATNPKKRLYDHLALRKALYIKQEMNASLSLSDAGERAEARMEHDLAKEQQQWDLAARSSRLFLRAKLDELEALAHLLRQRLPELERLGRERETWLARAKLEVVDFFARNPFTQDTATRLAMHLGRTVDLVQSALDDLETERVIEQHRSHDVVVCRLPRQEGCMARPPQEGGQE